MNIISDGGISKCVGKLLGSYFYHAIFMFLLMFSRAVATIEQFLGAVTDL
jgi:hypothetical protein